jgi:cobalt-zinc-cadmium efflux system protein
LRKIVYREVMHRDTHASCTHLLDQKALKRALLIAFVFLLVEIIGGVIAGSLALISDALHLFSDVGALALSVFVVRLIHLPSPPHFSYGYQRAEILGALASALTLIVLSFVLVYEAIMRCIHPQEVQGALVFIVAAFGLLANLLMIRLLHPSRGNTLNMRAAYLHVLGDLIGSVGVLIGGVLLWATGWNPIDPIITLLISVFILYSAWGVLRESIAILMESTPSDIDLEKLQRELAALPSVSEVHDLHIWTVSSKNYALSVHLVADGKQEELLNAAHELIETQYKIQHMTIQIEDHTHFSSRFCYDCKK